MSKIRVGIFIHLSKVIRILKYFQVQKLWFLSPNDCVRFGIFHLESSYLNVFM